MIVCFLKNIFLKSESILHIGKLSNMKNNKSGNSHNPCLSISLLLILSLISFISLSAHVYQFYFRSTFESVERKVLRSIDFCAEAICQQYNIPEITWTCKRIPDCRWWQNIINTAQEHRCGSNKHIVKICCPERTNNPAPTIQPTPKANVTLKPTIVQRKDHIQIIRNSKFVPDSSEKMFTYRTSITQH